MPFRAYLLIILFASAHTRYIPTNVREFYNSVVAQGSCNSPLQSGFYDIVHDDDNSFAYCGDHLDDYGIMYLQGRKGKLANMDIDCDGLITENDDGRCDNAHSVQNMTAMRRYVSSYRNGVPDLNPFVHNYVVFGNTGVKTGWVTFDPRTYGMKPLSVMAIVYGVWGDTNGDDGENPRIGEASISVATLCFGHDFEDEVGFNEEKILYIGFTGTEAVPGPNASWMAKDENEFESSISSLGDRLVERIGGYDIGH
ncbi:glycoside hydrolase family 75 protein [Daldinia bambusicola]|nr:glycoside hydrolase family 75 protein [Daldinia bambusicola]